MDDAAAQPVDPRQFIHEPWAKELHDVWTRLSEEDRHRLYLLVKRAHADRTWDTKPAFAAWQAADVDEVDRLIAGT